MNVSRIVRAACFVLGLAGAVPASAQVFRAYLSSDGSDLNPCTLAAPCRLLPAALTAVADGGEIWMLDPANYNTAPVTISKSVSIRAMPGVVASLVSTGNQYAISLGATARLSLRGIQFTTLANGDTGYGVTAGSVFAGSTIDIDDCEFTGMTGRAVNVGGAGTYATISNSRFRRSGFAVFAFSSARILVSRTTITGASTAVIAFNLLTGMTQVSVVDSVISGGTTGIEVSAGSSAGINGRATVDRSTIDGVSGAALAISGGGAGTSATITIGGSNVSNSGSLYSINSGGGFASITSRRNNHFSDNGGGSGGSITLGALD